jgi:hypothetical protein
MPHAPLLATRAAATRQESAKKNTHALYYLYLKKNQDPRGRFEIKKQGLRIAAARGAVARGAGAFALRALL